MRSDSDPAHPIRRPDEPATPARPLPTDRSETPAAWVDRTTAPCVHLALLLRRTTLEDPAAADAALATAIDALAALHPNDDTRDLGLRPDHLAAIRQALAAFLDESAAHQPGAERWREQLLRRLDLPRSANVGHEFFERLEPRLLDPAPSPADLAVLQTHALCLLLGFRGRYGARVDAAETEIPRLLRRLQLRLRPCLPPRPPPPFNYVPRDIFKNSPPRLLKAAALLLIFTVALAAALHARTAAHHETLRAHLATVAAP